MNRIVKIASVMSLAFILCACANSQAKIPRIGSNMLYIDAGIKEAFLPVGYTTYFPIHRTIISSKSAFDISQHIVVDDLTGHRYIVDKKVGWAVKLLKSQVK
jgi:hypothetical protein